MPDLPVLEASALSHIGPVRADNQDAVRLPDPLHPSEKGFLFALADGMGGYANGALASQLALEALFNSFYSSNGAPAQATLKRGVEQANLEVFKSAQQHGAGRMGTTLTAALFGGDALYVAHVGDSRAYLVRGRRACCLTSDHTTVGDLVRMRVIPPSNVRQHPQRSILNRAVGLGMFVAVDVTRVSLRPQDRLVLCSDGVWSVIEDEEFAGLSVQAAAPDELSRALIELALERETDDNISVVVVQVNQPGSPAHEAGSPGGEWTAGLRRFIPLRLPAFLHRNRP